MSKRLWPMAVWSQEKSLKVIFLFLSLILKSLKLHSATMLLTSTTLFHRSFVLLSLSLPSNLTFWTIFLPILWNFPCGHLFLLQYFILFIYLLFLFTYVYYFIIIFFILMLIFFKSHFYSSYIFYSVLYLISLF